jgi:ADP-dependent phosphofructokinase/glucokinase
VLSVYQVLKIIYSMQQDYDPYEIKLAHEIADTLNDRDSITLHLQYVRKYQEAFLRKTLAKVMSIEEGKIKRSRAALYTFLINQGSKYGGAGH